MTKSLSIFVACTAAVAVTGSGCAFNPSNLQSTTGTTGPGSGHTIPGLTSLTISPTSATLSVSSGGPTKSQQYKVTGIVNGHSQDVTGQVGYSTSTTGVVNVSASGLATTTNTSGGVVVITAAASGFSANATLTVAVRVHRPRSGDGRAGRPRECGDVLHHHDRTT